MNAEKFSRRSFLKAFGVASALLAHPAASPASQKRNRPNILFCIADDWSWPHASIAGAKVIKTPTFDRVASEGVLFENAFVSAPSCTPSRGAILTGQWHWRLEQGCNLWSTLPAKFGVYPDMLEKAGYHVGFTRKGWGPGYDEPGGRTRNPAGPRFKDFAGFLEKRPETAPFCFWFGSHDPHRSYQWRSGLDSGMNLDDAEVPAHLPDSEQVRTDICDYYWEVQRFDSEVGRLLKLLEEKDELDNTLVVITGDNGLPFPRCKSNLYDRGTNVPLAVRWPAKVRPGRVAKDFISLSDLAPTFLEAAGLKPTAEMTGKSFLDILTSGKSGQVDGDRDKVFTAMERHTIRRAGGVGYPMRAIRTHDYLYIRNFKPDRWPAGDPEGYGDIDGSPTKTYMMQNRNQPKVKKLFELAFAKRPAEELYDLREDPHQLNNVADQAEYLDVKMKLAATLTEKLKATKDPRVLGNGDIFDKYPYYGGGYKPKADQKS
ncbi:MAG: sulfatase-like hydrolase/transferase [Sedimentisphaerales bacterium]|nr:sulfatase-like hydrolase/transferase [Sedimentisphaerales bacterium]